MNAVHAIYALAAIWMLSTTFLGGVAAPVERVAPLVTSLLAVAALAFAYRTRDRRTTGTIRRRYWILPLLFLAVVAFQALPLPRPVLEMLGPLSSRITFDALSRMEIPPKTSGYPITFDTEGTLRFFRQACAFLLFLTAGLSVVIGSARRRLLAMLLIGFASLVALFGLVQKFSGATEMFWFLDRGWTFFGPFVSTNHAAGLFAAAAALTVGILARPQPGLNRLTFSLLLTLLLLALLFTGSRAGILAFSTAVAVYFLVGVRRDPRFERRPVLRFGVPAVAAALALSAIWKSALFTRLAGTPEALTSGTEFRLPFWSGALRLWMESPVLGIGMGAFSKASPLMLRGRDWIHAEHAENDLLELLACGGMVLTAIALVLLIGLGRYAIRQFRFESESATKAGFALALTALAFNALFVFVAPLPAHQLLAALLLSGLLASRRWSLFADRACLRGLCLLAGAALLTGVVHAAFPRLTTPAPDLSPPAVGEESVDWNETRRLLAGNPYDARSAYRHSEISARLGLLPLSRAALSHAKELRPLDLAPRLRVTSALGDVGAYAWALEETQEILSGPAPLGRNLRFDLLVRCAGYAIRLAESASASEYLALAEAIQGDSWRVPLLQAYYNDDPVRALEWSFSRAMSARIPLSVWDRAFFDVLRDRSGSLDLPRLVGVIGPSRRDAAAWIERIRSARPDWPYPLFVRLDSGKTPSLKPNTRSASDNLARAAVKLSGDGTEVLEIALKRFAPELDAYLLPVTLDAQPPGISFRMEVRADRELNRQLVVESEGRLFVTPERATPIGRDTYVMFFRNVGEAVSKSARGGRATITGVGFTPLEKDGRYVVGPIELYVENPAAEP